MNNNFKRKFEGSLVYENMKMPLNVGREAFNT